MLAELAHGRVHTRLSEQLHDLTTAVSATGKKGTLALFGDSITVSMAFWASLPYAHKNMDLLPRARQAGMRAIWFGIEDVTASLIKKGQTPEKTIELFRAMNNNGICPMPMMMHHDHQPLLTRGSCA